MRNKWNWLTAAIPFAVVLSIGVAANVSGAGVTLPPPPSADDLRARTEAAINLANQGAGIPLAPATDRWMMFWWNCEFRFVTEKVVLKAVPSPGSKDGVMNVNQGLSTTQDIAAQLGPQDPACLNVRPTQDAMDAANAELNRRSTPPGAHPPPDIKTMAR